MKYLGFTLIEVILVIGVITGIGAFVVPTTVTQIYFSRADSMANVIASSIYAQQQYSYNGYENNEYGIKVESNRLILYTGNTYDTRIYEKVINANGVELYPNLGGSDIIHFDNSSLKPTKSGTIRSQYGGVYVDVVINSEGLVYVDR